MELINKIEDQFINILSQNVGVSEINAGYLYALIRTPCNYRSRLDC